MALGARTGTLKNPTKCLWRWEPDRRSNFFFSPPAHLCAVTYMTEISLIVTLNNQITHSLTHTRVYNPKAEADQAFLVRGGGGGIISEESWAQGANPPPPPPGSSCILVFWGPNFMAQKHVKYSVITQFLCNFVTRLYLKNSQVQRTYPCRVNMQQKLWLFDLNISVLTTFLLGKKYPIELLFFCEC